MDPNEYEVIHMTKSPHAAAPSGGAHRWVVFAICAFALFLVGLDTTIVTVGLTEIGRGIGAQQTQLAWVIDAYTVPFASLLMSAGALADRFGRRRIFMLGLTVFGAASVLCALAPTLGTLIAARAVQGVGASMLTPVALAIVLGVMRDPRERALAIGAWGAVFGLSLAVGPLAGGALLAVADWHALFWVNAPVVAVALVLTACFVPSSRAALPRRLDVPGQLLLTLGIALAVGLLIEGPRAGWGSPPILAAAAALALTLAAFVLVEARRREPLLAPALFRVPSFSGAIIAACAVFIAFSVTLLATTSLNQLGAGLSPLAAGIRTLPMALAATICAPLSGMLVSRRGARLPLALAGGFLLVGGCLLSALAAGFSVPLLLAASCIVGAGVGFANAPITATAVAGLSPDRTGVASGTASTARQLGTAIGVAIAGGVVAAATLAHASAAPGADHQQAVATAMLPGWVGVAVCGLVVLLCAAVAPARSDPAASQAPHPPTAQTSAT